MGMYTTTQNPMGICKTFDNGYQSTMAQTCHSPIPSIPNWWLVQHNKSTSNPPFSVLPYFFFLLMEPNSVDYGHIIFFPMLDGMQVQCTTFILTSKQQVTSEYIMNRTWVELLMIKSTPTKIAKTGSKSIWKPLPRYKCTALLQTSNNWKKS